MLYFDEPHVLAGRRVPMILMGRIHMMSCAHASISFCPHRYSSSIFRPAPNISQLAPSDHLARSARARDNAEALHAPVTEIPSIVLLFSRSFQANWDWMTSVKWNSWHQLVVQCEFALRVVEMFLTMPECCRFWTLLAAAGIIRTRFSLQSWISRVPN